MDTKLKKQPIKHLLSQYIYQVGISIYGLMIFCASLLNDKARKLKQGQGIAIKTLQEKVQPDKKYVWFHAASLGEFEQGRPVIEQLKKENPDTNILLTFFSPSGYEIRKNYSGADVICYLPLDTRKNAKRFLNSVQIVKAVFIKYEFWPNFLMALRKENIPVYSISAIFRPEQVFFKWYGGWYKGLLKSFHQIFVQDTESMHLLQHHGIDNVTIAGDTRFDRVSDLAKQAKNIPIVENFVKGCSKVIVAGSTWPKDEEFLVRYMKNHTDLKLILVPHEIHEAHMAGILKLTGENQLRYTQAANKDLTSERCLIVDTIGLLSSIYRYGHVAYVGGGFGVGIHNTLEAAVWGVPVVFGPNYQRFREARELIAEEGGFSVGNYEELEALFDRLLADNTKAAGIAGAYVKKNTGATALIIKLINPNNPNIK
ncbi:MAG: glycosyltransferase N-terminal domain-containing protein [Paludibacter sp.]|nr:glycosyltransferase N-terminal domain-containing protein [Paludibacter sp.]